jgi:hypothetical protein
MLLLLVCFFFFFIAVNSKYSPISIGSRYLRDSSGKSFVLVGSTEHYGAVLNLDFNYTTYLHTIADAGLKLTRLWTGAVYREENGVSFNITTNTLAPSPGRYLAPWAFAEGTCCYNKTDGVPLYDLTKFNDTYFDRLTSYLELADELDIFVNLGLFSNFYANGNNTSWGWRLSPLNFNNNINGIGANEIYQLGLHPDIVAILDSFLIKLIQVISKFNNFYYEIVNEVFEKNISSPIYSQWKSHVVDVLNANDVSNKHLIVDNYIVGVSRVTGVDPRVGIWSSHDMGIENLILNEGMMTYSNYYRDNTSTILYPFQRPIGCGETGFMGTDDYPYRAEAWSTLFAGSAMHNNLDYSFSVASPDGMNVPLPPYFPGGGGPSLRISLGGLQSVMDSLPLDVMSPRRSLLSGIDSPHVWAGKQLNYKYSILASNLEDAGTNGTDPGFFAFYLWNGTGQFTLQFTLPSVSSGNRRSNWNAYWISPANGAVIQIDELVADVWGRMSCTTPIFDTDIALVMASTL